MTSMIADKTRAGLMGPNHVRRLERVEGIVKDPTAFTDILPTLDYDMRNISGAPFTGNLTRATVGGYRLNAKGVLVPTLASEPVIDFDANGKPVGTGFYGAYTNLILRSEELDNATWSKSNCTVSANSITGPDGTTSADTLTSSVSNGGAYQGVAISVGTTVIHTASVYLKQGSAAVTSLLLEFQTGGTFNNAVATVTWATLSVAVSGASNDKNYQLETIGNGWYRLSVIASNSGGANTFVYVTVIPAGVSAGTGTAYVWGVQLTATAFPVPYVPTTSAAVARNTDWLSITGADFTDFYNGFEGTIYFEGTISSVTTGTPIAVQISDNGFNNRIILYYDSPNQRMTATYNVGGVGQTIQTVSAARSLFVRVAFTYEANSYQFYVNGVAATPDLSGSLFTAMTRLDIGSNQVPGSMWDSHIRRVTYWPKALDAATLQRMSA